MAHCFPAGLGDIPPLDAATLNFWKLAQSLPDEWHVWISLHSRDAGHDFLLVRDNDTPIFVTHITEESQIDDAAAGLRAVGNEFAQCLPILASKNLRSSVFFDRDDPGVAFWDSTKLKDPQKFQSALSGITFAPASVATIETLRARIAPEVVIPRSTAGRRPEKPVPLDPRRIAAYALDYRQEDVVKRDLMLSPEGGEAVSAPRGRLVTGVAGCGKTLVLLHRAVLLHELNPGCSCLFTTHNKPLSLELQNRYKRLCAPGTGEMEQRTFVGWCLSVLKNSGHEISIRRDMLPPRQRQQLIHDLHGRHLAETNVGAEMLGEEFCWIKDNLYHERDAYLQASRSGRGFPLNESMRARVYEAFTLYREQMEGWGKLDWEDVPCRLLRLADDGMELPGYDAIFVDEAQFFPRVSFDLLARALKPGGHFLLAADPTQGFLQRRLSWSGLGIDIRGRSHVLTTCYRTTRGILEFARNFYTARLPEEDAEAFLPDDKTLAAMDAGEPPFVQEAATPQEEHFAVVETVAQSIHNGVNPHDILVLPADNALCMDLAALFSRKLPEVPVIDLGGAGANSERGIRICPIGKATGLEAPIVLILGLGSLLDKEGDPRMSPEERANLVKANTKRLYMAFTRASARLIVFSPPRMMGTIQVFNPKNP